MITWTLPSLALLVQLHSVLALALLLSADLHHRCLWLLDCVYEPSLLVNRFLAHHSEFWGDFLQVWAEGREKLYHITLLICFNTPSTQQLSMLPKRIHKESTQNTFCGFYNIVLIRKKLLSSTNKYQLNITYSVFALTCPSLVLFIGWKNDLWAGNNEITL